MTVQPRSRRTLETMVRVKPVLAMAMLAIVVAGCAQSHGPWDPADHGLDDPEILGLVPGEAYTIKGVVVDNSLDPCVIDDHPDPCDVGGPEFLRLDVDGAAMTVIYSYGEDEECLSRERGHGGAARVGTRVEVFGRALGIGEVSGGLDICQSEDHYIDLLE